MRDFSGQIVYITGGSSGIGLELALQLAALGAHVAVFSTQPGEALQDSIEAARRSPTQRVARYAMDISQRQQVLATIARAAVEFGTPDLVLNSAGVGISGSFLEQSFADFERNLQVNLYGSRHLCEAVVPLLRARGHGTLALIGSMAGIVPVYGYSGYSASKFAVVGFAECLRQELKPIGIRVVLICPGEVETPMIARERESIHPATRALKDISASQTVQAAASEIVRGLAGRRALIVTGRRTRLLFWLQRLTIPAIWRASVDTIIARALRKTRAISPITMRN